MGGKIHNPNPNAHPTAEGPNMSALKKKLFKHLDQSVYCRLGISPVHGIGVFAIRAIPKGVHPLQTMAQPKEIKFTRKEIAQLPKSVRQQINIFCYHRKDEVRVSAMGLNTMDMAFYLNHSKEPNLRMKKSGEFETLRRIQVGEELMMDYDHSFGEKHVF
jgi:SET domain-containing protein